MQESRFDASITNLSFAYVYPPGELGGSKDWYGWNIILYWNTNYI